MFVRFAVRDIAIVAVSILAWRGLAQYSGAPGPVSDLVAFVLGALLTATAFVLHEWGHLLAALACRSRLEANTRLTSGFSFSFDPENNSLNQFLIMSLGGFVATALLVWLYYAFLPDELFASRVARGGVLFLALLGVTLELPLLLTGLLRASVPSQVAVPLRREDGAAGPGS